MEENDKQREAAQMLRVVLTKLQEAWEDGDTLYITDLLESGHDWLDILERINNNGKGQFRNESDG